MTDETLREKIETWLDKVLDDASDSAGGSAGQHQSYTKHIDRLLALIPQQEEERDRIDTDYIANVAKAFDYEHQDFSLWLGTYLDSLTPTEQPTKKESR